MRNQLPHHLLSEKLKEILPFLLRYWIFLFRIMSTLLKRARSLIDLVFEAIDGLIYSSPKLAHFF